MSPGYEDSTLMIQSLLKGPTSQCHRHGVRISTQAFWGRDTDIQPITLGEGTGVSGGTGNTLLSDLGGSYMHAFASQKFTEVDT